MARTAYRHLASLDLTPDSPQNTNMDRDQFLATLRAHESEFRASGILGLSLFGSVARGETLPSSDIDVAVRLGEGFSAGGFDYFSCMDQLESRISRLLGRKVDLIEEPVRKARFQNEIEKDRAVAF